MNIFVLDTDVIKCSQYHLDKHVIKMILESTQLLNNALIVNDPKYQPIYRATHLKHPCSIWTSKSRDNFDWLLSLGLALCDEYSYRYEKIHKCQSIIKTFQLGRSRYCIPSIGLTSFIKCMPDQYKVEDTVISYRNYYRGDKAYIAKWTRRPAPEWWNND